MSTSSHETTTSAPVSGYAELVARVHERLSKACKYLPDYLVKTEVALDFDEIVQETPSTVSGYLIGDVDKFRERYILSVFDADGSDDRLSDAVDSELRALLDGAMAGDVARAADALGEDGEAFREMLVSDERLCADALGIGRTLDLTISGSADITANLGFSVNLEPSRELFVLLEVLRVPHDGFLDAVRERCLCDGLTAADADVLRLEFPGGDPAAPLFDIYQKLFLERSVQLQKDVIRPQEFLGEPVIDVRELVDALIEKWGHHLSLYVHLTLAGQELYDFGDRMASAFTKSERGWMHVGVKGMLSASDDSSDESGMIAMRRPLMVQLRDLSVTPAGGASLQGGVFLGDVAQARADALAILASAIQRSGGVEFSEAVWHETLEELRELVVLMHPFVRDQLLSYLGSTPDNAVAPEAAKRLCGVLPRVFRQPDLPHVLGRELLAVLGQGNMGDDEQSERASWLLREGADPECATAAGVMPAHLAAQECDVHLLSALAAAGADLAAVRADRATDAGQNAITIAIHNAETANCSHADMRQVVDLVLDQGGGLPPGPFFINGETYTDGLSVALLSRSDRLVEAELSRLCPAREAEHQVIVDQAFWGEAVCLNLKYCSILLDAGANPNRVVHVGDSVLTLEEAIRNRIDENESAYAKKYGFQTPQPTADSERYQALLHMIHAARAKKAVSGALASAKMRRPSLQTM